MPKILVIDDEQGIVWAFEKLLKELGHRTISAATAEAGLSLAQKERPDLIILDVMLPGMDGLTALEKLKYLVPNVPVIVITAHGGLDVAVRAVKLGAAEYLSKPIDITRAELAVRRALEPSSVSPEVDRFRREIAGKYSLNSLVGRTASMQEVFKKVATVCASNAAVLLVGESGTGKELVARAIHYNSPRAAMPFEPINCAAIPESLLESELYGHEKGAFTGAHQQRHGKIEQTDGGTVFLDEIGDMPAPAQIKLLRFLEDGRFERVGGNEKLKADVRIVSATHRDLQQAMAQGRFREDLFYRLNVVPIALPSLRERREDIPLLVAHFLEHGDGAGIHDEAMKILQDHSWPGNVRELKNVIERGLVLSRGKTIHSEHLPPDMTKPSDGVADGPSRIEALVNELMNSNAFERGKIFHSLEAAWERAVIAHAMKKTGGNQVQASELLGINRLTLRKKIEEYGL